MAQIRSSSVGERRFVLALVGLFGALTLVLAALGVYGVIALVAAERTAEVGIRLALGASPMQVLALVIGHAVRLTAIGIAIGAAAALALTPLLGWQLFGIGPADPVTYVAVAALLASMAVCAALVPARRAMRIDPAATLRT
jgi:ABC-type antimicrobial peptide transport system permease subunit